MHDQGTTSRMMEDSGSHRTNNQSSETIVQDWLANIEDPWLLILDNCDDPKMDYAIYFPSGERGSVLMTTRVKECAEIYSNTGYETFDSMPHEDATELLLKACRVKEDQKKDKREAAEKVVDVLGRHALAITQASAYINRRLCTIEEYPDLYKGQRQSLFKHHPNQVKSTYGDVYATFEVSAEWLQSSPDLDAQQALQLLRVLAFVHRDGVSEDIFLRASRYAEVLEEKWTRNSGEKKEPEVEGFELEYESDTNSSGSFETASGDGPEEASGSKSDAGYETAREPDVGESEDGRELKDEMEHNDEMHLHNEDYDGELDELRPWHVEQARSSGLLDQAQPPPFCAARALLAQLSLITLGQDPESFSMHPLVHEWARDRMNNADQEQSWNMTGSILALSIEEPTGYRKFFLDLQPHLETCFDRGFDKLSSFTRCWNETQMLYAFVLPLNWSECPYEEIISRKLMDQLQNDNALSRSIDKAKYQLAVALRYTAPDEAAPLFEELLEASTADLGAEASRTLDVKRQLARGYFDAGKVDQAVELLVQTVETQRRMVTDDLRWSLFDLGYVYREQGQHRESLLAFEEVYDIEKRLFGPDHPNSLQTHSSLANAYSKTGNYEKAIKMLEEVVNIQERIFKPEHREILITQHTLGIAYHHNGNTEKAIKLLEEVVRIEETTLRPENPDRLASQHELAAAYRNNGSDQKAVDLLEEVVRIRETTLQPKDPKLLGSQYELAFACTNFGDCGDERAKQLYERAVELLEKVASIEETTLKPEDPTKWVSRHELGIAHLECGNTDRAIEILEEVVEMRKTFLEPEHPELLGSMSWLQGAKEERGQQLISQHNLAIAYTRFGDDGSAIQLLEEVIRIRETFIKPRPDDPYHLHSISELQMAKDRQAQQFLRKNSVRRRSSFPNLTMLSLFDTRDSTELSSSSSSLSSSSSPSSLISRSSSLEPKIQSTVPRIRRWSTHDINTELMLHYDEACRYSATDPVWSSPFPDAHTVTIFQTTDWWIIPQD